MASNLGAIRVINSLCNWCIDRPMGRVLTQAMEQAGHLSLAALAARRRLRSRRTTLSKPYGHVSGLGRNSLKDRIHETQDQNLQHRAKHF